MAEFLSLFPALTGGGQSIIKVLLTLLLLVFGHVVVKLITIGVRRLWIENKEDITKREAQRRVEINQYIAYTLDAAVIILSLLYLNVGITTDVYQNFIEFLPNLLSATLIGILGLITIKVASKLGSNFLKTVGIYTYFREVGLTRSAINLLGMLIRGFLYLLLLQVILTQVGIGDTFVNELINASSWAAAFLVAGLLFYGFKDLFVNYAAGIYLKNSRLVRPGEEVAMEEESGEIRDISLFSTTIDTDRGYTLMTPNSSVMEGDIKFKRAKSDIKTLEDIKSYFVAESPEYYGPATVEMALDMFGYRVNQEDIAEKLEIDENNEVDPEEITTVIENVTNENVKAAYIPYDKITDVEDEFKAWFNDGALVIPNFYKPELFPEAEAAHYVLSVGVEGSEILIIDPSSTNGGVYYVDEEKLEEAMNGADERGYIVLAPEDTTAYWRIKNDLLYSDKQYYDEISKTLENRLRKLLRQGKILREVMPGSVQKYMEEWKTEQNISRLWKSEAEEEDENTGNN